MARANGMRKIMYLSQNNRLYVQRRVEYERFYYNLLEILCALIRMTTESFSKHEF